MSVPAQIVSLSAAMPPNDTPQEEVRDLAYEFVLGDGWRTREDTVEDVERIGRLFAATGVERRQFAVNLSTYYRERHTTEERMAEYERCAYPVARRALECALESSGRYEATSLTDLVVVSCTGHGAPGLDVRLARDTGMQHNIRRVVIGHMGCYAAITGLRDVLNILRGRPEAVVALVTVELCGLHFRPTRELQPLTSFALFGDAAAAMVLSRNGNSPGPKVVDTYCATDFASIDQMTWKITDEGFLIGLSMRVPVALRRSITPAVESLLKPHGLEMSDITHWLVHPGGPSIVEAIQGKLGLTDDQVALSWEVLRDHGNCSSSTILVMLDRLLRSGQTRSGEWGVMMAFGPGLTIETCLIRF